MAQCTNIYYILCIVGQNKSSKASRKTSKWQNIHPLTFNTSISNNMCRKLAYFGSFFTNEVYSMMLFQIVLHVRFKNRDYLLFLYDSLYQCCMDSSQISTSDWYWRVLRGNTTVMVLIVRNLVFDGTMH